MHSESKRYALKHRGYSYGEICERLQGRERQAAMAVWQWSAVRFSSLGTDQDRYFKRYGAARTFERINRVRSWLGLEVIA
jgi:hypothetical protein